jgi:phosphate transport system substrate-binding protein
MMYRRQLLGGAALALLASTRRPARASGVTLNVTGSTLLHPLFELWVPTYQAANPGVTINATATDSGAGIAQTIAGKVQIGLSDAYMSDEQAEHNREIVNIPLAISAQTVNYNLPGLNGTPLKLDGPTLAGIYSGGITEWDAAPIAAMNPDVHLPHQPIVPIRRADPSGDTFIFTQFLDFSTQEWEDAAGYGTSVDWPTVPGELAATGNAGMLKTLGATPYSIAYIGISFSDQLIKAGLGTALLKNQSGKFLLPTAQTVSAGASVLDPRTPADERLSLVFAPGDESYPLINYEYAVVSIRQSDPAVAAAIRQFLLWGIATAGGNSSKYLDAVHFIPLPDFIRALSENQIGRIR